ncbi:hypothetical protein [Shimia abyssi]|uniref:Outer membrane beta-barrel porin/alpha-amylase n=1 Tax=Shimia abyssi TaxID=1662395 RepID=A0A2P8EYJ5_9RHOB|nr:hypothetical protein [Shimia abyssi]PSL14531.1 hypothetical protein CLV88_1288 [Shimia abyssi]
MLGQKMSAVPFTCAMLMLGGAAGAENASNPLAAVNSTDLRVQPTTSDTHDKVDVWIDGAYMITPKLKFKYELHYNSTDITGTDQSGFEKLNLKPLYFPTEGKLGGEWMYKTTVGVELILDLGEASKGTSAGADQIAPLFGAAFTNSATRLTLIPLFQHFVSYNGSTDISQSSARLIAIKPFGDANWLKLDAKIPYDWENNLWPATAEIQVGRNLSKKIALYGDVLIGIGADRPYDYGLGVGLRFNY